MLTKRIIPCLDIKEGRTVKGINFVGLRDAGDPVELAEHYSKSGADELVFLDITATVDKRKTLRKLVKKIAQRINIPFTVGGGITSVEDAYVLLQTGADKIAINSAAIKTPNVINALADKLGNQCVVLAVDAKEIDGKWKVYLSGGRIPTEIDLFDWVLEAEKRGVGEILFTSMNHDGTKTGFANQALAQMTQMIKIPVIASGGAGTIQHFVEAFKKGNADAALAASVFHYKEIEITHLKRELKRHKIEMRLE